MRDGYSIGNSNRYEYILKWISSKNLSYEIFGSATNPYTYDKYIFIASHAKLIHSSMIPNVYQTFQKYRLNLPSQFHLLLRNVYFD